jgi:hypothetical protein
MATVVEGDFEWDASWSSSERLCVNDCSTSFMWSEAKEIASSAPVPLSRESELSTRPEVLHEPSI